MIQYSNRIRLGFDIAPKPSGPGRYLRALISALDPQEFEVVVFAAAVDDCWPHVKYLGEVASDQPHDQEVTASHSQPTAPLKIWPNSLRALRHLPFPPACRLWAGFYRDVQQLSRKIRAQSIDLFHAQNTGCEQSPVAARRACRPLVLGTFHVDGTYDLLPQHSSSRYRALEWYSNSCLHQAIAVSEGTKQYWVRRSGISEQRVRTIHNGIDPDKFSRRTGRSEARQRLGIPDDGRIVLGGVGRLDRAKGLEYLIGAMAELRGTAPQALLVIAGSGPLERQLLTQARALGLENSVKFLGFCKDVDLVYDALDVFVLSSICDAMPFALLEAMSHALPAVGTKVGGVSEVICQGVTGLLSEPSDSRSLATAVLPLLTSQELRQRMGTAGRSRVINHFHEKDMVAKTLEVYRSMAGIINQRQQACLAAS